MVVSGRSINYEDAGNTIGPLFNTIPVQILVEKGDTWSTLIKRCHSFNTAAVPYQHTPLRDIMKWTKRTSKEPLFDTLFVYQRADNVGSDWARNDLWNLIDDGSTADYPLAFEVEQSQDGSLSLTIVAQGHVLDYASSSSLLDKFETALTALLMEAESLITDSFRDICVPSVIAPGSSTTKGFPALVADQSTGYEWGSEATTIRAEIATLAGIEAIEINENTSIFELGLDSIDAIKLSSRLKKRHIDLPVSSIMRNSTISKVVRQISSKLSDNAPKQADVILPQLRKLDEIFQLSRYREEDVEYVLPATPLQEGMIAEMISSDFTRYFNHDILKVSRHVDLQRLREAFSTVYQQSPILQTSFMEIDDPSLDFSYAQFASTSAALPWKQLELAGEDQIPQLTISIREAAARSKSLENLFQTHVVICPEAHYLVLSLAHALYDGWSLSLFHEDIRRAYFGQYQARPSYRNALLEMRNASGSEAYTFWQNYLSGAPSVAFPIRGAPGSRSDQQHRLERASAIPLSELRAFSKKYGVTLQTIGQTVWSLVLASYLHSLEVVFGSILSGRDSELTTDMLFPTMNTVAIRMFLHGSRIELLRDVQDNFANIRQYQHFPLRIAQRFAASPGTALLDTLFIYQKSPDSSSDTLEPLYESIGGSSDVEYLVCTEMEVVDNGLIWRCATHDAALDEAGTAELLDRFDLVLKNILDLPNEPVIDIGGEGTSICGLPSYPDQETLVLRPDQLEDEGVPTNGSSSTWSSTELTIRDVLSAVAKIPQDEISKSITLFHLGLDSISAIKVSSLLRKQDVHLSVGDMLRAATVEKMAQLADERKPGDGHEAGSDTDALLHQALENIDVPAILVRDGISPDSFEKILPASAGQIYMLCNWRKTNGILFYPEFQYRTSGPIKAQALRGAWNDLVAQNPLLRTYLFATKDPEMPFLQGVLRNAANPFHDISDLDETKRAQYIEEHSTRQPYASLFAQHSENQWLLTLKVHHALYDGVSLPVLVRQLHDLCKGSRTHSPGISAFTRILASSSTESARKKRQCFWASYLEGVVPSRLAQPNRPDSVRASIFRPRFIEDVGVLEQLSRQHGLSIQSLFLAAYGTIYSTLVSREQEKPNRDVVIGIYLANRSHAIEGLSNVAAPTVNLVPLRVKAPLSTSLLENAAQVQRDLQEIGSLENSAVALWEIEAWTGVKIDSFVNFLKLPESEAESAKSGLEIREVRGGEEGWSMTVEPRVKDFVVPGELKDDVVWEAYLVSSEIRFRRNSLLTV
jgi:aryl carrier-like protein